MLQPHPLQTVLLSGTATARVKHGGSSQLFGACSLDRPLITPNNDLLVTYDWPHRIQTLAFRMQGAQSCRPELFSGPVFQQSSTQNRRTVSVAVRDETVIKKLQSTTLKTPPFKN